MNVYLAGGFRSGWQDEIKGACPGFAYFDPRLKPEKNWTMAEIGTWDFHYIRKSDIVFAYMERDNPSGIGLSVEIGYARGLGKTVVLVLEENHETISDISLSFAKNAADAVFEHFHDGIEFLRSFSIEQP